MKKARLTALILITLTLITSCKPQAVLPSVTPENTDTETSESTSATESETTFPEPISYFLPKPYIDIEFYNDGTLADAMGHVSCSLNSESDGAVVNRDVSINGKKYNVPHLYVKNAGGVAVLNYKYFSTQAELLGLLENGFTIEAFIVNHNRLTESSNEQCLCSSTQSGGYNFSTYKGKYTFSVHTDGSYRSAQYPKEYDNVNLSHLVGVYDPDSQTATLYVNGVPEVTLTAPGMLKLANDACWQTIILGGDISPSGKPELLASNTRIADYKLYPSTLNDSQVTTAYEAAIAKLTGEELGYDVIYADPEDIPNEPDSIFKSISESYADIYLPKTGLVSAPAVLTYANSGTSSLAKSEKRPATVIFGVKLGQNTLIGTDKDGKTLGTLDECVRSLEAKVIPAFRLNDVSLVNALRTFINVNKIGDCFVISSSGEILKNVCEHTRSARPILDLTPLKDSDITASKSFVEASACGTKTVLINASALTQEKVLQMRSRSLSVFAVIEGSAISDVHSTVFCGVMGIVAEDSEKVISYYESITDKTQNAPTLIVAHRGDMQNCPENILRSFISAERSGASAIELDVWLTKDGHLVINHDSKTSKWNKQLTCTESTREELKALKLKDGGLDGDEIAFYDEVMEYFSKDGSDVVFTVEIKDKRNAVTDKIVEITEKYGMKDRVIIICMSHSIVRYAYEKYGYAVQMIQSYPIGGENTQAAISYACTEVVGLHSSYYSQFGNADVRLKSALWQRGIKYSPWTASSAKETDSCYALEYPEFTGNFPHHTNVYARFLKAEVSENGKAKITLVYYDGSETDVTHIAGISVISGEVTFKDGYVSGSGVYSFRLKTSLPLEPQYKYYVYSAALTN